MPSYRQRAKELTRKVIQNPFFPLLFTGEAVKASAFHLVAGSPPTDILGAAWLMAAASVVLWLFGLDDVKWGWHQVEEAVDE